MRVFHCDQCGQLVFFENTQCVTCQSTLAYVPDRDDMVTLVPDGDRGWRALGGRREPEHHRLCANYTAHDVCNWACAPEDPHPLCRSCQLTTIIPDLGRAGAREAWYRLEVAKRRLVYSLLKLRLPLLNREADAGRGLAFQFLADPAGAGSPVFTGHADGAITIDIAEADDAERERRRIQLHEPYRTLLGHFRHESGHYYWSRLIAEGGPLEDFRARFGDERQDYRQALDRYYAAGPPGDWSQRFISAYASSHPWEDWAESWSHYLHMVDMLETASVCGLSLRPGRPDEPTLSARTSSSFEAMIDDWFPLTYVINNLNRGLGLSDGYPFVIRQVAIEKLRFVHDTVMSAGQGSSR